MRVSLVVAACAFTLNAPILLAGFLPGSDSSRVYPLAEVVVTASRFDARLDQLPSLTTRIDRETIDALPGSMVSDVLAGQAGLVLRPYGGGGALQTVSLRGSSPEHTLVLVDGQRMNAAQNGLTDFGLLASQDVEKIEIVRGGYSSLYGADALGGVVNIVTRAPAKELSANAHSTIGSNEFSLQSVNVSGSAGDVGVRAGIQRERGQGNYQYLFDNGNGSANYRRNDADYSLSSSFALIEYGGQNDLHARVDLSYVSADRGVPGQVFDPSAVSFARQSDVLARIHGALAWTADPVWTLQVHSSVEYGDERYGDPGGIPSTSMNRSVTMTPEAIFAFGPLMTGTAGFEYGRAMIESTDLVDQTRITRSAFLSTRHIIALPFDFPFEAVVSPSLRLDGFSDVDGAVSPRLGVNFGIAREERLRIRASYGSSYRAPSFNDLYSVWGGNTLLKPERSKSFDAGIQTEIGASGRLRGDASYFSITTKDRILWTPDASGMWAPKNLREVRSEGFESQIIWTSGDGKLTASLDGTATRATKASADTMGDPGVGKLLPFVSRYSMGLTVIARVAPLEISLRHLWSDDRYADEANTKKLPAYGLTSAAVSCRFMGGELSLLVKIEGTNLLNTDYVVMDGYPMPLREFRGTVGISL